MRGPELLRRFLELDDAGRREAALGLLNETMAEFNEGNHETLLSILSPDVEWIVPDILLATPPVPGRAGVAAFLMEQTEPFDEFRLEAERYERAGDRVVVVVRQHARGRASGLEVEIRVAQLWTLGDDGLIARFEGFPNAEEALTALRAP